MVDVAHDRDDRGARHEILGRVVERLVCRDLVVRARDRDLALSSAPIISTASFVSDCVMPTSSPRPIMIF